MLRRGFVERRVKIIAQGRGQRRFISRLNLQRIDQRRPQITARGPQQICQSARFRIQALEIMLGFIERDAGLTFREGRRGKTGLGQIQRYSSLGGFGPHRFHMSLGGTDIGHLQNFDFHRLDARLQRIAVRFRAVRLFGAVGARAFIARAHRIEVCELRGQPLQIAFAYRERGRQRLNRLFGLGQVFNGRRIGRFEFARLAFKTGKGGTSVLIQDAFAREILLRNAEALAQALRVLASASLFRIQTVAFVQEPLQGGALDRFGLAQWRHLGRGLA